MFVRQLHRCFRQTLHLDATSLVKLHYILIQGKKLVKMFFPIVEWREKSGGVNTRQRLENDEHIPTCWWLLANYLTHWSDCDVKTSALTVQWWRCVSSFRFDNVDVMLVFRVSWFCCCFLLIWSSELPVQTAQGWILVIFKECNGEFNDYCRWTLTMTNSPERVVMEPVWYHGQSSSSRIPNDNTPIVSGSKERPFC